MKSFAILVCTLVFAALSLGQGPPAGYVPDSKTAVRVAEAVLMPVYGEKRIESEEPFTAKLENEVWTVSGTLWCSDGNGGRTNRMCVGGAAEVRLSKVDARIISMIHYK
jgi:hypothetical protein